MLEEADIKLLKDRLDQLLNEAEQLAEKTKQELIIALNDAHKTAIENMFAEPTQKVSEDDR